MGSSMRRPPQCSMIRFRYEPYARGVPGVTATDTTGTYSAKVGTGRPARAVAIRSAVTQPPIAHSPSSVTPAAAPCPSRMELTFHFSRMSVEAVTREEIALHHDLAGKVALVTGGSRGIGAAVARALAGAGADVAITYLSSRQAAENVAGELRAKGVRARSIRADQADPAAAAAVVREVADEFGGLDILVNNTAVAVLGPVDSPAPEGAALHRHVRVHYTTN